MTFAQACRFCCLTLALWLLSAMTCLAAEAGIVFDGGEGPGKGKNIVMISGDEEYRSEEALPQLAKMLSKNHGFHCTVVFAIDPKDGTINPNINNNIPGLEAVDKADLLFVFTRFRNLPDDQMQHIADYVESGKPVIGMRTATHAFTNGSSKKYAKFDTGSGEWKGGFGKQVLGETWVNHHGAHGSQSTRGIIAPGEESNPILRGIKNGDIWGPTDVYTATPIGDSKTLVFGEVLEGMSPDSKPLAGEKNNPMQPVAWTKSFTGSAGKAARVFTTTMGAATDLEAAGTRRMIINATYWCLGMEDKITPTLNVDLVGEFKPTRFGFNGYVKGKKPEDYAK